MGTSLRGRPAPGRSPPVIRLRCWRLLYKEWPGGATSECPNRRARVKRAGGWMPPGGASPTAAMAFGEGAPGHPAYWRGRCPGRRRRRNGLTPAAIPAPSTRHPSPVNRHPGALNQHPCTLTPSFRRKPESILRGTTAHRPNPTKRNAALQSGRRPTPPQRPESNRRPRRPNFPKSPKIVTTAGLTPSKRCATLTAVRKSTANPEEPPPGRQHGHPSQHSNRNRPCWTDTARFNGAVPWGHRGSQHPGRVHTVGGIENPPAGRSPNSAAQSPCVTLRP